MNCRYKLCHKEAVDSKICPFCCKFMYCSDDCLKLDWETHRYFCTPHVFILKDFIPLKNSGKTILGKGAYGEVQLVQHAKSKHLFALKVISKAYINYQTPIEIFLREISVHKSAIHPNITRLYDHLEDKNNIYLVLEYVEKGSIYNLLKKKIRLREIDACEYFKQACIGVGFLHEMNIIHRDIKSENLLISKENVVKLCDFGWCAIGLQPRVTFCGTADYMAPEMSQSESYNNKVDIWALGILLYEMLHGRTPYLSGNVFDKFVEIQKGDLRIREDISNSAKELIRSILQMDPDVRPCVMQILKNPWFSENISCKLRVGNILKHAELGNGNVVNVEGNVCTLEFGRVRLEMVDTEAVRLCEVIHHRGSVFKSQELRTKPPLAKANIDKTPKLPLGKVNSAKEIRKNSPVLNKRTNLMNTSVESLFKRKSIKTKTVFERSYININDISISPIRNNQGTSPIRK